MRTRRRIALAISAWLGAAAWGGVSRAQVGEPLLLEESLPYLTVTSEPSGAVVRLSGEYEWAGRTPWSLHRPLSGLYRVEAHLPGYQLWKGQVLLSPGEPQDLRIELSRKSRVGAAARSLVFPGWGQHYNDVPGRGWVYTVSEIVAVAGTVVFWEVYQDRVDEFDDAAEAYQSATTVEMIRATRAVLEEKSDDADAAYDRYVLAAGVAVGIYGLAFLDALIGPTGSNAASDAATARAASTAQPGVGWHGGWSSQGGAELGLTVRW